MKAIVAYDLNRTIGIDGGMPWHCPKDLKRFKALTTGHVIIMGYKTWASMDRKTLPDRNSIVLSRGTTEVLTDKEYDVDDTSLKFTDALLSAVGHAYRTVAASTQDKKIFVIGGEQIYQAFLDKGLIDQICVTQMRDIYSTGESKSIARFPILQGNWHMRDYEVHESFDTFNLIKTEL